MGIGVCAKYFRLHNQTKKANSKLVSLFALPIVFGSTLYTLIWNDLGQAER